MRIPLGIRAFGLNAYAANEEGGRIIEEHDELGAGAGHHEELLRRAAELDPRVPGWAQADSDLDAIRGEPGFPG